MLKNIFLYFYRSTILIIVICLMSLAVNGCSTKQFNNNHEDAPSDNDTKNDIIWFSYSDDKVYDITLEPVLWNEFKVSQNLKDSLTKAQISDRFALMVSIDSYMPDNFFYSGKTIEEHKSLREELKHYLIKLRFLKKEGHYLKYGDNIYISGAPDGERWSEEFYNKQISFYGNEMIEKYIINNVFLNEKLDEDILLIENEISTIDKVIDDAKTEYYYVIRETILQTFTNLGFECTFNGTVITIFITKEEFTNLKFEQSNRCIFTHATHPDRVTEPSDD